MVKLVEEKNNLQLYELEEGNLKICVTNFGASIYSVEFRNASGRYLPMCLSCDGVEEFSQNAAFFGATVGRTVNRTKLGRFTIDGKQYQLDINDGVNSAHGGTMSYAKRLWESSCDKNAVTFTLHSKDGEAGYPGNVDVTVKYQIINDTIHITHHAVSDADTIVNLTNHTYWNITGNYGKIYDEILQINGSLYLETAEDLIPTGQILTVRGTELDFTEPKPIGQDIVGSHISLVRNHGYDLSYVRADRSPGLAAVLSDPNSKIKIEVKTSYPDFHIYTGNFLDGDKGVGGRRYYSHDAICMECELLPDAINNPHFGKAILRKGEEYDYFIDYSFTNLK